MVKAIETLDGFAKIIHRLLNSDRDVNIGVAGFTGEGKTTFISQLLKNYSKISGTYWGFDRMTWSRKELMKWIDGEKKSKAKKGLKEGQLPEYSSILADELFPMFYRRNWYEEEQIDAIKTFNMCRDRHLLLAGGIPNFWELDGGFINRIRFYVYVPKRGIAWVFQQENNPFCNDNWNVLENKKRFRKKKNPYNISNFICEIRFPDWSPKEKKEYYKIRAVKRVAAIDQNKSEKTERYTSIKAQRDELIRLVINKIEGITHKDIAEVLGISKAAVSMIYNGIR